MLMQVESDVQTFYLNSNSVSRVFFLSVMMPLVPHYSVRTSKESTLPVGAG